jgi:hypothetical protein
MTVVAGNDQTARIGTLVPVAPAIVVRDQDGQPMSGVPVTFSVKTGGGMLTGGSTVTNSSGIATLGSWTLGNAPGQNIVAVAVSGGTNPTSEIVATARPPRWTFMVFLAADNNLALDGVADLDEMEFLAANPEVQVVIQGEFSAAQFGRVGMGASAAHLSNFNTFRYAFGGSIPLAASSVPGPNGSVTDIGNRNMTDPVQLREFVTWARAAYPAERYALVLWNHGDGLGGLIEDETSAPGRLMNQRELNAGLNGTGVLDVLNFDMCQMGGYETLETIRGLASFAVFSQANEPSAGDPYSRVLTRLYANPSMDGRALARAIVEEYDASYAGQRSSTTKSAFEMTGYTQFRNALDNLATSLRTNVNAMSAAIRSAAAVSQRYELPVNKDLVNALDSMYIRVTDATVRQQINAVREAMTASTFLISSKARNGSYAYATRVERSSGLHIVLPTGIGNDAMSQGGNRTLAEYLLNYPARPWSDFLKAYVGSVQAVQVDLGSSPWELYLVWDSLSFAKHSDVDIWVLEPDGNVFIPFIGTVTPNGHLTADSEAARTYYEGYLMNRFVQAGRYKIYASLYQDTANTRPIFDVEYRRGYSGPFTSLYSAPFPRLSLQTSWTKDPAATFANVEAGAYTDLRYAAFLDVGPAQSASVEVANASSTILAPTLSGDGESIRQFVSAEAQPGNSVSPLQLQKVFGVLQQKRAKNGVRASVSGSPPLGELRAPSRRERQ